MFDINHVCQYCFSEIENSAAFCPHCGKNTGTIPERSNRSLPQYTILAGRYLIGRVLGEGGFGITYLAMDLLQEKKVAVKEYFPVDLATRDTKSGQSNNISIRKGETEIHFRNGMRRFESEALTLRKFDLLPGIVSVLDFFSENNTAYLVMEYIEGGNLKSYLKAYSERTGHTIPWNEAFALMRPVLDSLQKIHSAGIIHRDISPENILIDKDDKLVLIDFGSSKTNLASRENRSMTVMVKHGYAPEEQYRTHGDQGPWTDIYAVCATLYHMISGILPEDAIERLIDDKLVPLKNVSLSSPIPAAYSNIIEKGMQTRAANRYQTMEEMISDLDKANREIEEAKRKAKEAKQLAEAEAARKAEEEARRKAQEARRKAEEDARRKTEEARRLAEAEAARKAEEKTRQKLEKAIPQAGAVSSNAGKNRTGIVIAVAAVAIIAVFALLLGPLRSKNTSTAVADNSTKESSEPVSDINEESSSVEKSFGSITINDEDRDYIIRFFQRLEEEGTIQANSGSSFDEWYALNDEEFAVVSAGNLIPHAQALEDSDPLLAAILYSRLNDTVRVEMGGPTNEEIVTLWQTSSDCNDIDYRTQRLAAINKDGTVRALCSPAGSEDFSEVENWNNIVSVCFARMGGQLYGLKSNGTIVCNRFNCEKFGELNDVISITSIVNGYTAALCLDGSVYLDAEVNGELYKVDDSYWKDIKYITGGYSCLIGFSDNENSRTMYYELVFSHDNRVPEIVESVAIAAHENFTPDVLQEISADLRTIFLRNNSGKLFYEPNPAVEVLGSEGSTWMTQEDIERTESYTDIIKVEHGIYIHSDGTVDACGMPWDIVSDWTNISDITYGYGDPIFAITGDGTIRYYDPSLSVEDYFGDLYPEGLTRVDDYTIINNTTGGPLTEEEINELQTSLLSDFDLADAVNWTGLRTRPHTASSNNESPSSDQDVDSTTGEMPAYDPNIVEVTVNEDGSSYVVGTAFGYSGDIQTAITFSADGIISEMEVDSSAEAGGLGTAVSEPAFINSFIGRGAEHIDFSELDAVSGATISAGAVLSVVNLAIDTRKAFFGY